MRHRRRGYTFVELLTVLLVLAILCGLAVLRYIDLKHRAYSARVAADLEAIRLAAYGSVYETGAWPAERPAGVVPPEMRPQLGAGFTFTRPQYTLDWENLGASGGSIQVGVTVTSSDSRLMAVLAQIMGNKGPFIMVGDQLTMIIVGPDGQS